MILKGKNFLLNCETLVKIGRGANEVVGKGKNKKTKYTIDITYQDRWDLENNEMSSVTLYSFDLNEREQVLQDCINQAVEQLKENNNENNN